MNKYLLITSALILITMAGCQEVSNNNGTGEKNDMIKQSEVIDRGTPYSNGPSAPPDESVGPTAPPPEINKNTGEQAQAVTTNENIRLTLPRKTE